LAGRFVPVKSHSTQGGATSRSLQKQALTRRSRLWSTYFLLFKGYPTKSG